VFNRGTLGGVVTPDGTLWMSLFRACSGWPSGVWIDGDRRTAPDGSSFAWQHWSHTFGYALASSGGHADWRSAGFNAAAEDYNHGLTAVVTPATAAGSEWQLSVEGAPNVALLAVKPAGNPLAAGLPGTPARSPREVTVRLRETDGETAVARLRLAAGIEAAWRSDLLEERYGEDLPSGYANGAGHTLEVAGGAASVPLRPFETVTLRVRLAPADASANGAADDRRAGPPEPAQPVYTRYWLHGKGPAPAGNAPVAVHFSPTRVTLGTGDDTGGRTGGTRLALTVACGPSGGGGAVELIVPRGLAVSVLPGSAESAEDRDPGTGGAVAAAGAAGARVPLPYDLGPNGFAAWDLAVSPQPGTPDGRYFVTARITDGLGQVLEDAALVTVGEPDGPDDDLPPEELFFRLQSDVTALTAEADLEPVRREVRLAPGETGSLEVRVASHLASELRGEVQLVSPFGTWTATRPWTQAVTVEPGGQATVRFDVTVPATAPPGWESWLLVKLMYFGRVRYSESVPLIVS
jgi:alpha-mannosidase